MKSALKSKTLWINIISIVAILAQAEFGFIIDAESQFALLAVINLLLRAITKEELDWK